MLLVSNENCVGNCMLALSPNGSQSEAGSRSCVIEGYPPWCRCPAPLTPDTPPSTVPTGGPVVVGLERVIGWGSPEKAGPG